MENSYEQHFTQSLHVYMSICTPVIDQMLVCKMAQCLQSICSINLCLICSKFYQLFLPAHPNKFTYFSHFILVSLPIYSHIILYALLIQVLTSRETHILTTHFDVAIV